MEMNRIYCGDNLPLLDQLTRENLRQFDLILTDPPYNVGKDFGNDTDKQTPQEFEDFIYQRAMRMRYLLASRGSLLCFASQKYAARTQIILEQQMFFFQRMMIWHYKNGLSRQVNSPVTEFEPILWHTFDPNDWNYNGDDVRVPYRSERVRNPVYKKNKKGEKIAWTPDPRGAKRGDVWEYPCLAGKLYEDERTEHPTQKPESLIIDLIRAYCPKNADGKYEGNVLDPFCGSGTVPVCCEKLNSLGHNIQWVGIEIQQNWVDVANERLSNIENPDYIL